MMQKAVMQDTGLGSEARYDAVPSALGWLISQAEARERRRGLAMIAGVVAGTGALATAWGRAHLGL